MLFAFGRSEGSYYIANGKRNYWKNVPNSLAKHLNKNYVLQAISFGVGDTWFFREAPRDGTNGSYCLSSAAAVYYPCVQEIYQSDEAINWVAFGPRGQYVVDTQEQVYHSNTDKEIVRQYEDGDAVPLRCASFGYEGAWVCVEDDGVIRSSGLSAKVQAALGKKAVRNVQLSANSSTTFFIEYVDGQTEWSMPSSWCSNIESIENISVRLDDPGAPGEQSVSQRIIFAFGHKTGEFCISNGQQARWRGIDDPDATARLKRAGTMQAFSLGENGAWFWRQGGSSSLSAATKMAYPEVWRICGSDQEINWVAFGPQGYYIIDTDSHIYASRSDTILRNYKSGKRVPLRCGSFGYGGAWVVVEDDGVIRSSGLSPTVLKMVKVGNVRNVQLSITDPDQCYIEYMDGTSDWRIPKRWHDDVSLTEGNLPTPSTASNNTNTGGRVPSAHTRRASIQQRLVPILHLLAPHRSPAPTQTAHQAYAKRIGNEQKLWHATLRRCKLGDEGRGLELCADAKCSLCQIIRTGFKKRFSLDSGMFGKGIYTSTTSSKIELSVLGAAGYSENSRASKYKAILLNNVVVGRAYETNKAMVGSTAPPKGFNSVCGLPGSALKYDETCVYDDDAIRPTYLILYDAKA
ncbi:ADP-ribosylation [Mycena venus]|uniref:ADP-ribosylation n=1 Tax=Mycena venus TaxID=2733690 RepID=A0A8H6YJX5_9AGAR|nr:ADP-ribosylation [Mycena venus]